MVRLRAHGAFATRVTEPQLFVNQIVGSRGRTSTDAVEGYLREIIVARLNDVLGETVKTLLELPEHYDELAEGLKGRVAGDFGKYGLELVDFYIGAIVPPEDVQKIIDERTGMAAIGDPNAYLKFKAARALGDAANNPGGDGGAATGVGLGAGIGLGASMAQMMKDAMGQPSGSAPAGTAPATAGAFCANCGAKFPEGAKFCTACGAKRA
jgi:membrane protease subunit (stomatin/prohibitin family)